MRPELQASNTRSSMHDTSNSELSRAKAKKERKDSIKVNEGVEAKMVAQQLDDITKKNDVLENM